MIEFAFLLIGIDPSAIERGKMALEQQSHLNGRWTMDGYRTLWKVWGEKRAPENFDEQVYVRYGLPKPPYANHSLPMGLRTAINSKEVVVLDCMLCHGGNRLGSSYVGQPNTDIELTSLFQDLSKASKLPRLPAIVAVNRTRGVSNAGALGVLFFAFRDSDLNNRAFPLPLDWTRFPDLDAPAWWLLKKKKTMYCDGGMSAESTRSMMQFMLIPGRDAKEVIQAEQTWDDIRQYILSIEPPKYPFKVDFAMAERGNELFQQHCSKCHGTYGSSPTYPNVIVPLKMIGTDPARFHAITDAARKHYNSTWFGEKHSATKTQGYQAPPLDGVWATAPYFHNGSVPTIYQVLNSKARPERFKKSADPRSYDAIRMGIEFTEPTGEKKPAVIRLSDRSVFDTSRFGASNAGHTFGDKLSDRERFELIEYLKTL